MLGSRQIAVFGVGYAYDLEHSFPPGAAASARKRLALGALHPWQAKGLAKIGEVGKDQSSHGMIFPASAGMQTRLFQAGFCIMDSGSRASREWSRARSGFRAQRERAPGCRGGQPNWPPKA